MATNKVVYNGKTLIDLTGDTVTESGMASGVKAHDKSGTAITGTLKHRTDLFQSGSVGTDPIYNKSGASASISISQNVNNLGSNANTNKAIVQQGDILTTTTRANKFGDAPQNAVVSDYTFTSANGVNISGTLPRNPDVTHTVSSVETHVSTIGGYNLKFAKITGTWNPNNDDKIGAYVGDQDLTLLVDASKFGNASVREVKKGVTFTSINGVKLTGTLDVSSSGSTSSNNNCEAYLVDVTNPTVSFKTTSGTIKAYGYAYATTKSQWGGSTTTTMYAFNGTNYYKSVTYGTPSATSITLGASNGKLTGLPNLTSGTLLVTRGI